MKKLSVALLLFLGLANAALAQTKFTMPPPAGVFLGGYQVVTTCGTAAALVAGNLAFGAMDTTGVICTSATGGGGGAVTIADGADVTLGAKADAVCGSATGTCTLVALMKYLNSAAILPLPAQSTNAVNIGAVMNAGSGYETVAASQTGQALGASGATGDYLSHCVIYPTTTTPGVVTVFDNASAAGANVIAFPGGASSVSNLAPIAIPVGAISTAGAWKVTTGANLVVTCYGKFT